MNQESEESSRGELLGKIKELLNAILPLIDPREITSHWEDDEGYWKSNSPNEMQRATFYTVTMKRNELEYLLSSAKTLIVAINPPAK